MEYRPYQISLPPGKSWEVWKPGSASIGKRSLRAKPPLLNPIPWTSPGCIAPLAPLFYFLHVRAMMSLIQGQSLFYALQDTTL
jgi:hypothetical protein